MCARGRARVPVLLSQGLGWAPPSGAQHLHKHWPPMDIGPQLCQEQHAQSKACLLSAQGLSEADLGQNEPVQGGRKA